MVQILLRNFLCLSSEYKIALCSFAILVVTYNTTRHHILEYHDRNTLRMCVTEILKRLFSRKENKIPENLIENCTVA
jgi:hypothetical protein